ncbi:ShlB/FhaC/HecB family hemolysin secretion/activation protein [Ramlibacter sp. WS9]|uniref:ShlB/FhaC/HecB family hemolysin secretion/activation protein n=1 Tax=Ramlibacter sp. WS9 TaxID=1882741 RepID=UPI0011445368|nr:ShlB/FhaC/HecB family hemolysin secretion/activation protein [Ramlibacter sp. WS9]ROZ78324.1 ShlB/FhaC/HecB family hemolysin secretion/activation protein [Ramlibacter sp. WS9]
MNLKDFRFLSTICRDEIRRYEARDGKLAFSCAAIAVTLALQSGAVQGQTAPAAKSPAQKINITSIRVEGNTLLPEGVLAGMVSGVQGPDRTLSELNLLATRIQNAYRDAGFGGVVAFVPEQDVTSGNVVVRVVEGKLAAVRVTGNSHFTTANVRAGLPNLREGATPVVRAIDRDIQLSNENPAKELKVTLTAGSKPGDVDAEVNVSERDPLQVLLGYNNTGNEQTGRHRLSVGAQHSNLFGRDHVATIQYQTSPEHPSQVQVFSVGYHVPLYDWAGSVDAFYAHSNVRNGTTSTPAGPLTFAGKGEVLGLRGNRNLDRIGEYDHRVTLGVDFKDYQNDCALGNFGPAACGSAGVSISVAPVMVAYTGQKQGPQLAWGINASLAANAGGSSADTFEAARPGARKHYVLTRLSGFAEVGLAGGFALAGRADAQYTPHALISGEKFGLGGAGSVRGYEERELSGDYGVGARFEVLGPMLGVGASEGFRARPLVFVDHGRVSNHKGLPCRGTAETSCSLSGVGLGARLNMGKHASASVEVGRALDNAISTSKGDYRAHVSINVVY